MTLVELLVTLAVLGVVLSLGVPAMGSFMVNRSAVSHASLFSGDLRFARSEALKRGVAVSLCAASSFTPPTCTTNPGTDGFANGWIVFSDADMDGVIDNTDTVLRVQQALTDKMSSITSNTYTYTFLTLGITLNAASRLTFSPKGSSSDVTKYVRTLCVARTGRVVMKEQGVQGERACS